MCVHRARETAYWDRLWIFPQTPFGRHQSLAMTVIFDMVSEYITSQTLLVVNNLGSEGG
jgi:hypothetical protein